MVDPIVPPEVQQEFEEALDADIADWTKAVEAGMKERHDDAGQDPAE